ncbi:TPA: hypothetical protein DCR49_10935 [Candidatus Delongbacteria bacterium]|nr:hypothetical protein [Candidatus Delongbacteria bacterium]
MNIEEYAKKHKHYLKDQMPDELDKLFRDNSFSRFIDIGCGGGLILYSLYKRGYDKKLKEIWGVDLSSERLKGISSISADIKTVQDDAQTLVNVPDNYFDIVVSTQVIEHVPDDGAMINSLSRITAQNGIIYIDTVFKKKWAWYFYKNQQGKYALDPTHVREYMNDSELLSKLNINNMEILLSRKQIILFPVVNFIVRRLKIKSTTILENPLIKLFSLIKVPVPGYYIWKIILKKK